MSSSAGRVSILATMRIESGIRERSSSTSAAERTKDWPAKSGMTSSRCGMTAASAPSRASGDMRSAGTLTPCRERTGPPRTTSQMAAPSRMAPTRSSAAPSASNTRSPGSRRAATPGSASGRTASLDGSSGPARATVVPDSSSKGSACSVARRSLGPGRSARMPTVRPAVRAAARTTSAVRRCSSAEPCEKLMRAMSRPASMRRSTRPMLAGPMVATSLVRRVARAEGAVLICE